MNANLLNDLKFEITVELGQKKITLKDLVSTNPGSIIELNTKVGEPIKFYVNGKVFGTCELVLMPNEKIGMKVLEVFGKK